MGAAIVAAVSTGATLIGSGSVPAAGAGTTTTTVVSIPKGVPTDIRHAQADLSKAATAIADLKAQQKAAESDLKTFEKDVEDGALEKDTGGTVTPAHADEVSAAIAHMFATHDQAYAAVSAQAQAFHEQFVNALSAAAQAYAGTEARRRP